MRTANRNPDSVQDRISESAISTENAARPDSIDELIAVYADPIIKKVLLQRLNIYFTPSRKVLNPPEAEDLYQTVILKLIALIGADKTGSVTQNISEMTNYVAMITHNVCNDFLRMKYPERNRLKNKLRDLMRRHPDYTCWVAESRIICGRKSWIGLAEADNTVNLVNEFIRSESGGSNGKLNIDRLVQLPLSQLTAELFSRCRGPIELDHLVLIISNLQGIKDGLNESLDVEKLSTSHISDSPTRYYEHLEVKELLLRLWEAVCDLPLNQRRAFIFTSSDHSGESLLHRVLRERVITMAQLYQSLDMTREELISIWQKLPMNAPAAASVMGTSAGMVAKWRHRALKRLSVLFERE